LGQVRGNQLRGKTVGEKTASTDQTTSNYRLSSEGEGGSMHRAAVNGALEGRDKKNFVKTSGEDN